MGSKDSNRYLIAVLNLLKMKSEQEFNTKRLLFEVLELNFVGFCFHFRDFVGFCFHFRDFLFKSPLEVFNGDLNKKELNCNFLKNLFHILLNFLDDSIGHL